MGRKEIILQRKGAWMESSLMGGPWAGEVRSKGQTTRLCRLESQLKKRQKESKARLSPGVEALQGEAGREEGPKEERKRERVFKEG